MTGRYRLILVVVLLGMICVQFCETTGEQAVEQSPRILQPPVVSQSELPDAKVINLPGASAGESLRFAPRGIASSPVGNWIALSDTDRDRIHILDAGLNPVQRFGRFGQGPLEFNAPTILRVPDPETLAVYDVLNHRIQVVTMGNRPKMQCDVRVPYLSDFDIVASRLLFCNQRGMLGTPAQLHSYSFESGTQTQIDLTTDEARNRQLPVWDLYHIRRLSSEKIILVHQNNAVVTVLSPSLGALLEIQIAVPEVERIAGITDSARAELPDPRLIIIPKHFPDVLVLDESRILLYERYPITPEVYLFYCLTLVGEPTLRRFESRVPTAIINEAKRVLEKYNLKGYAAFNTYPRLHSICRIGNRLLGISYLTDHLIEIDISNVLNN